jgi:hypothetical protein
VSALDVLDDQSLIELVASPVAPHCDQLEEVP